MFLQEPSILHEYNRQIRQSTMLRSHFPGGLHISYRARNPQIPVFPFLSSASPSGRFTLALPHFFLPAKIKSQHGLDDPHHACPQRDGKIEAIETEETGGSGRETYQRPRSAVERVSVVASELGIGAAQRGIAVCFGTLYAVLRDDGHVSVASLRATRIWGSVGCSAVWKVRTRSCALSCSDCAARRSWILHDGSNSCSRRLSSRLTGHPGLYTGDGTLRVWSIKVDEVEIRS